MTTVSYTHLVLFDEIDVIALDRINSNDVREMGRVTSTILRELDRLTDLNKEIAKIQPVTKTEFLNIIIILYICKFLLQRHQIIHL